MPGEMPEADVVLKALDEVDSTGEFNVLNDEDRKVWAYLKDNQYVEVDEDDKNQDTEPALWLITDKGWRLWDDCAEALG